MKLLDNETPSFVQKSIFSADAKRVRDDIQSHFSSCFKCIIDNTTVKTICFRFFHVLMKKNDEKKVEHSGLCLVMFSLNYNERMVRSISKEFDEYSVFFLLLPLLFAFIKCRLK